MSDELRTDSRQVRPEVLGARMSGAGRCVFDASGGLVILAHGPAKYEVRFKGPDGSLYSTLVCEPCGLDFRRGNRSFESIQSLPRGAAAKDGER